MATRRYSVQPGDQLEGTNRVTEAIGAATAAKSIELTFDLGLVKTGGTQQLSRSDVLQGIATIRAYILQSQWPPA